MADLPFRAVVELITVIEERFGFEMDREDITAEVFESGRLAVDLRFEHRS